MRRGSIGLTLVSLSAMVFLYGPIFVLVLYSFNAAHLSMAWRGATLKWYAALVHDEALLAATANSLLIAVVSTIGATCLGGLLALGMERMPHRRQQIIEGGLVLPLVIPEVMMGVALMLFFVLLRMPLGLTTVMLGHIVFNIPLVTIMLRTRLRKLDPALGEAAADLGASSWQVFRYVTLPLLRPALWGAVLVAFTVSLDDFLVTFFTAGPGATTLPLKVYSMIKSGVTPEINALSALLLVFSMTCVGLALHLQRREVSASPRLQRIGVFTLCLLGLTGSLSACGQAFTDDSAESRPVLHYFTWSDYVGPEIIQEFERREQVKVVIDTFSSNEELLAKLQSGATGYDVAVPSDFMVAIMIQQGLLSELDQQELPNAALLEPHLQALHFDPERRYSVPYLWGTVGIGYDSAVILTTPDSWSILWDPRYKGRISMLNDQREVFGAVLRSMGQSMNSTDPKVIEAAKEQLLRQKPLVKTYTSDHYDQLLASGEVVLAHGWGGPMARAMAERPSIRYVVPKEGATLWADCLVVLRTAPQKRLAMRFINFLMEPEVAARTSERLRFASASRGAREHVSASTRDNPAIYPPVGQLDRLEWMRDVGGAIRLYDRAWTELKMQ